MVVSGPVNGSGMRSTSEGDGEVASGGGGGGGDVGGTGSERVKGGELVAGAASGVLADARGEPTKRSGALEPADGERWTTLCGGAGGALFAAMAGSSSSRGAVSTSSEAVLQWSGEAKVAGAGAGAAGGVGATMPPGATGVSPGRISVGRALALRARMGGGGGSQCLATAAAAEGARSADDIRPSPPDGLSGDTVRKVRDRVVAAADRGGDGGEVTAAGGAGAPPCAAADRDAAAALGAPSSGRTVSSAGSRETAVGRVPAEEVPCGARRDGSSGGGSEPKEADVATPSPPADEMDADEDVSEEEGAGEGVVWKRRWSRLPARSGPRSSASIKSTRLLDFAREPGPGELRETEGTGEGHRMS